MFSRLPLPLIPAVLLSLAAASAQPLSTAAKSAPAEAPPAENGRLKVSGSFRTRTEMWNWWEGAANNTYAFQGNIFRLSFSRSWKSFDWQVDMVAPFLLGLPNDAIAPAPQLQHGLGGNYFGANQIRHAGMAFPKQAFVRFKSGIHSLRLGRFEFNEGAEVTPKDPTLAAIKRDRISQRVIGAFAWTHVGRAFDGAHYTATQGNLNYTVVAAKPTRGVFQTDGWGTLDTAFAYGAVTGQRNGTRNRGEWRAFGIYYDDWRRVVKTDARPLAVRQLDFDPIRIGTFGGHYLHVTDTAAGPVDLTFWGVLQTGRWGRLDHRSGSAFVEIGLQPKILPRLKPWLRAGFTHGHGDGDPNDGTHTTFFQILTTPRPFARTPFYNMMNNDDFYGILTLRPNKSWTIKAEAHALRLANPNDLWYLGGGAFQPWSFGFIGRNASGARSLANLFDVSVDWNANAHFAFTGYLGYFTGRAAIQSVYPRGRNGAFGYLELTYRF
jgi:hypothetical protein